MHKPSQEIPPLPLRFTAALLLGFAIHRLFPHAQLIEGQATDFGFFYTFVHRESIDKQALPLLEQQMYDIVRDKISLQEIQMMCKNGIELFRHLKQPYKIEILAESENTLVNMVRIGDYYDLAPLPFLPTTEGVKAIKLHNVSCQKSDKEWLIHIEGIAASSATHLKKLVNHLEAAAQRDHQSLLPLLGLAFQIEKDWLWLPKGNKIREMLWKWWEQHRPSASLVTTPPSDELTPRDLHSLLYQHQKPHFESDHPVCYAEWVTQSTDLLKEELRGLLNTSTYTTDFTSFFCTPPQVPGLLISSLQIIDKIVKMLHFSHHWCLRTKKPHGTSMDKGQAVRWLENAAEEAAIPFTRSESVEEYGARLELVMCDAYGREWNGPYIAVDCYHAQQHGLYYSGKEGKKNTPVMLVCSILGSVERFLALLIEQADGLPPWLQPESARILPVAERHRSYADQVRLKLESAGILTSIDEGYRREGQAGTLGARVHAAEVERIPYLLIIGDREQKEKQVTLRRTGKQKEKEVHVDFEECEKIVGKRLES